MYAADLPTAGRWGMSPAPQPSRHPRRHSSRMPRTGCRNGAAAVCLRLPFEPHALSQLIRPALGIAVIGRNESRVGVGPVEESRMALQQVGDVAGCDRIIVAEIVR